MKKLTIAAALIAVTFVSGCQRDAQVASRNLSKAADMFELQRRIVLYNGITGEYMLTVEGKCSVEDSDRKLAVTCKQAEGEMVKHYLGLSDNVTYFSEQVTGVPVSVYHNRIIWKPQSIIPNIDINGSADDFIETMTK